MCRVPPRALYYQQIDWGMCKKGRITEDRIKQPFYTMQRINPLGSTVSQACFTARGGLTTHGAPGQ
ncbi:unnamed protein product [Staurois parvus]|uniref:Uncharacterized protein n=1 Tax=Staurois parvus TaxID=386267 RepID=A0ABN9C5T1_9NEOB|nr:unnamed protein product [Staurois parvus]